jgi:phage/plasmid-associated DNA primase
LVAEARKDEVFKAYQAFCKANGYQPLALNRFMVELNAVAPPFEDKRRTVAGTDKRVRWLVGIALTQDAHDLPA